MKNKDHLPIYGIGPVCVYSMVLLLIVAIILHHFGLLDSGSISFLRIPLIIIGTILIILGICMWINAVIISKIDHEIKNNHLLTKGAYAYVRNPIYSAIAIALSGISLMFANMWFLILPLLFYIDITIFVKFTEEKWLLNLYGEEYKKYCQKVNRCIPWFPKK